MTSNVPHQSPHHDLRELQRDLNHAIEVEAALAQRPSGLRAPPAPATPPPAKPDAPAPRQMWGLHAPRSTSPMEILVEVADDTYRLQAQVEALITAVTGQQPVPLRLRDTGPTTSGLLPNMARLAHEIAGVHAQIARRISQALEAVR